MIGELNAGTKFFLVAVLAKKQVLSYCLTTTLLFIFREHIVIPGGRFIVCEITTNGKQLTLINVYAPNDDNPTFFNSVFEHLDDFKCEETLMIGGDYNLVLGVETDEKKKAD